MLMMRRRLLFALLGASGPVEIPERLYIISSVHRVLIEFVAIDLEAKLD